MKLAEVSIETLNAWVDSGYMTARDYYEEVERRRKEEADAGPSKDGSVTARRRP